MTKPQYPDADRSTVFEEGLEFQDFVANLLLAELGIVLTSYTSQRYQWLHGENRQGIEIKLDRRIHETGNVSIEVAEKTRADVPTWTPSGIMREDNAWLYVQGNPAIVLVFGKATLRLLYEKRYQGKTWEPKPTIRTFLLPLPEAERLALKVFRPVKSSPVDSMPVAARRPAPPVVAATVPVVPSQPPRFVHPLSTGNDELPL